MAIATGTGTYDGYYERYYDRNAKPALSCDRYGYCRWVYDGRGYWRSGSTATAIERRRR